MYEIIKLQVTPQIQSVQKPPNTSHISVLRVDVFEGKVTTDLSQPFPRAKTLIDQKSLLVANGG